MKYPNHQGRKHSAVVNVKDIVVVVWDPNCRVLVLVCAWVMSPYICNPLGLTWYSELRFGLDQVFLPAADAPGRIELIS